MGLKETLPNGSFAEMNEGIERNAADGSFVGMNGEIERNLSKWLLRRNERWD